jgi:AraC-like DNA-binding protein
METRQRVPAPLLQRFLLSSVEGWTQVDGSRATLREVPIPGVPLIFGIESAWQVDGEPYDAFVAGLHARPAYVQPVAASWSCIEVRLTPLAAHRILGVAMHELADLTVPLADLVPEAGEVAARIAGADSWNERFDLVESFLLRRLTASREPAREVEWSWRALSRSGGLIAIGDLARDVGWSHRRLIARFREQVGMAPKGVARVLRFDRAAHTLRSSGRELADVAYECGYFDQAHMNRDFRELGGTTPGAYRSSLLDSGAVAA